MTGAAPSAGDRTLRCALVLEPSRKDALQLLYAGRLGAGRFEEASTFARRALAIDPQSADDNAYTRAAEAAYRGLWRRWCEWGISA